MYTGSCSALALPEGRQANMEQAKKEGLKTEKVFSDHWKLTIYRPEWLICLVGPRDAQTALTHTVYSVRDDHFHCTSRWMETGVFACLRGKASL